MTVAFSLESNVFHDAEGDVATPVKIDVGSLSSLTAPNSHFGAVSDSSQYSPGSLLLAAACDSVEQDAVSILAGGAGTATIRRTSPEAPAFHILHSKGSDSECSTTDGCELCATNPHDLLGDDASSLMFPSQWVAPDPHWVLSVGSRGHYQGNCKPCAFFHKPDGCLQMSSCPYCHLCHPDEKKRRKCDKRRAINTARACRKGPGK